MHNNNDINVLTKHTHTHTAVYICI